MHRRGQRHGHSGERSLQNLQLWKGLGTVTIHIPKLVYGDLTGVVTAEETLTETVVVAANVNSRLE